MTTVGLAALTLYAVIFATRVVLALRYAETNRERETIDAPVTIVQPILSGDPLLEEALRSNVANASVTTEFLWLVDTDDAEGQRVTRAIDDPRVRRLECPPARAGENPKTAKLQLSLPEIRTPYFAVLDDDTVLAPEHLGRALHALQSCTLYTGLPSYGDGPNVWSSLVAHFVNNNSILTYLPLLPITPPVTINGMFYVMHTDELRAMGGFAPIVGKLCDDYALAAHVKAHGGTIRQGTTPQFLRTTVTDGRAYFRIMQRWFLFANVLLRDQSPRVQALLIIFLGLPAPLFALSFLTIAGGLTTTAVLAAALLARHLVLRSMHAVVFRTRPRFRFVTSIVSELLQPMHWLHASLQHTLRWRTRHIVLGRDGTFRYVGAAE